MAVCLGCGCTCDDIEVIVRDARIVEARNACELGVRWFGDGTAPARVQVAGRDATLADALDAVARLLGDARRPLVYLAPDLSCEAQRAAIALADYSGALLDSVTTVTAAPSILAAQEQGRAGATLGEIRNRGDVLVFWGVDPATRYPRYWTRYAPEPAGLHVPEGRRSRVVVAVDIGDARGPADADVRVSIAPGQEVAALARLRAAVADPSSLSDAGLAALDGAIRNGRYTAVVADAEPDDAPAARDTGRAAALIAWTQGLNEVTRCALSVLRAGGNRSGAEGALTSQTGYPMAVDFGSGVPRYRPFDGARERLRRGEIDAALVCGSLNGIPPEVRDALARARCAVIGPRASEALLAGAEVVIDTGVAGIHEGGTALRMDEVALPLARLLPGPPDAADTLRALAGRLALTAS